MTELISLSITRVDLYLTYERLYPRSQCRLIDRVTMKYEELCKHRSDWMKARNDATTGRPNHYKKWTTEEEIIASDPSMNIEEKAELLGRTVYAVNARMVMLGVTDSNRNTEWTDEELSIVLDPSLSHEEVSRITGRSLQSVIAKRYMLKSQGHSELLQGSGHQYSDEDDEFIIHHTMRESAEHLHVTIGAIRSRRSKLRKRGKLGPVENRFTEDDLKIISDLSLSHRECSELLGRPVSSIKSKRYNMRKQGLLPAKK